MLRRAPLSQWHQAGLASFTVLGAGCVVGTFLPWLRTGRRTRSSYELFETVDRLGFAPDGAVGLLIRWWPIVPLLVTAAVVLHWWRRFGWGLVAASVASLYVGGVAIALAVGSAGRPIDLAAGTTVSSVAAAAFLVNACLLQLTARLRYQALAELPIPSTHAQSL